MRLRAPGTMTTVRDSAAFIASHSKFVKISPAGVDHAVRQILDAIDTGNAPEFGDIQTLWRRSNMVPSLDLHSPEFLVDWVFLIDTLNFSFWSDDPAKPYTVSYGEDGGAGKKTYSGYAAMVAAVKRALDAGIPITSPSFYQNVKADDLRRILNPDEIEGGDAPMMAQRVANLHQAGTLLCAKYNGSFANVVKDAKGSAQDLVGMIAGLFPHYNDVCTYRGKEVAFFKRAQIVVADIWACFGGGAGGYGDFKDIDSITMFADYRVPQILSAWGVLEYAPDLSLGQVGAGSVEECELRGCSIEAVEQIVAKLKHKIKTVNAVRVDFFLWNYAKEHGHQRSIASIPIHLTRTVFY